MDIINKLLKTKDLTDGEFKTVLESGEFDAELFCAAESVRKKIYGDKVFARGLIEISNFCKNNCFYCGIRRANKELVRYRLSEKEILSCCEEGYGAGLKSFVLQGGEDPLCTDDFVCSAVFKIKKLYPDCAVALSLGEKPKKSYQSFFDAGADRYLLKHETAETLHYSKLHPRDMSLENRKRCLFDLKEIGYQTGSGFMVGSPFQTTENIISDLRFLQKLKPHMIGIGPFIRHPKTPFAQFENGSVSLVLRLVAVLRLMFPCALIPATTALATVLKNGRELGIKAGANVVMPNLSPKSKRELYSLYENKAHEGCEAAENLAKLEKRIEDIGYKLSYSKGDAKGFE